MTLRHWTRNNLSQINQLLGLKKLHSAIGKNALAPAASRTICAVGGSREAVDLAQSPAPRLRYASAENAPKVVVTFELAIGGGRSMPKIIDILLDEHQNIEKLLLVLGHELDRKDPLFNRIVEERFHNLQRTILRWEQETEKTRLAMTRIQQ
jgi:hypothetical protein